jgi:hypothetical protein
VQGTSSQTRSPKNLAGASKNEIGAVSPASVTRQQRPTALSSSMRGGHLRTAPLVLRESAALVHAALEASDRIFGHMPVRVPQHLVCRQLPHELGGFRAHRSEPAREVTDPQSSDRTHSWVRRRQAEADTPALDERSILVV